MELKGDEGGQDKNHKIAVLEIWCESWSFLASLRNVDAAIWREIGLKRENFVLLW